LLVPFIKKITGIILISFSFLATKAQVDTLSSQEDTIPQQSISSLRFNIYSALILNSAYSNVPVKKSIYEENSVTTTSPVDTTHKIKAGFTLGLDMLLFPKENFKVVFGVSFSQTSAEYLYTYLSETATNRTGYTLLTRENQYTYKEKISAFNFQAGIRNYVYENVYLTTTLMLTRPRRITRVSNGYTRTTYSNNSGGTETSTGYITNFEQIIKKGDPNFSIRLSLEYQFDLSGSLARIFIFRNFGFILKQPWWGLGFSYSLKN
jgi:hypothetical protein